jgi:hypothetical protein
VLLVPLVMVFCGCPWVPLGVACATGDGVLLPQLPLLLLMGVVVVIVAVGGCR